MQQIKSVTASFVRHIWRTKDAVKGVIATLLHRPMRNLTMLDNVGNGFLLRRISGRDGFAAE